MFGSTFAVLSFTIVRIEGVNLEHIDVTVALLSDTLLLVSLYIGVCERSQIRIEKNYSPLLSTYFQYCDFFF